MTAESALIQIKAKLIGISDEDLTTAEKQIKDILGRYFKCTCKPNSMFRARNCKADKHN